MSNIYFRMITRESSSDAATQAISFLHDRLASIGIHHITNPVHIPYWKNAHFGELTCQCNTAIPLTQIQQLFATEWQSDTADIQWSRIHIPGVCFLWISD